MPRFDDYLDELQTYAGLQPRQLISAWDAGIARGAQNAIAQAIQSQNYIGWQMPDFTGSNQSLGNKAAAAFLAKIAPAFTNAFRIEMAPGKGYPDTILTIQGERHFLEFKATSDWNPNDGNRRVLTSSPLKMRSLIESGSVEDPPAHAVATVLYQSGGATVEGFRLDFLDPSSPMNIRLEASTSHKLLAAGDHTCWQIP